MTVPGGTSLAAFIAPATVLRERSEHDEPEVGPIELFFDLVYVFTIIQLSHYLLEHGTWRSALEAAVVFLAVWWAWNYTAWAMNWLSPHAPAVRLLTALLMLFALGMAVAIPEAFDDRGLLFAVALVCLHTVRSAYLVVAFRHRDATMERNYQQLLAWTSLAGVVWIVGALVDGPARLWVWAGALVIDYLGPMVDFWLPGRGRRDISGWSLVASHLAERNRLVFIIALGESILIMGGALSGHDLTSGAVTAAGFGFALLFLLWWIYFDPRLPDIDEAAGAAVGRSAFAYAHAVMVAGAILIAVAIEQVIAHPDGHPAEMTILTAFGGTLLYLVGNLQFVVAHGVRWSAARLAGVAGVAAGFAAVWALREELRPVFALAVPAVALAAVALGLRRRTAA